MSEDGGGAGRSAAWGVVAALFGAAAITVWVTVWPASVFGAVAIPSLYQCFASLYGWWPVNRRHDPLLSEEFPTVQPLGVGLGALIPSPPEPAGPLVLALEDEDWNLWQRCAWVAAIKVRITNTATQVIRLERFHLESDPGPGERPKLTQDQITALFHETVRCREAYSSSHLRWMDLQPGDSVSGWWVQDAYLPYPERAGRPRCVFRVTDGVGDIHELEIPARQPQVRRMEPHN